MKNALSDSYSSSEDLQLFEAVKSLPKFKETKSGQYRACCPAHDDKNPSLSITHKGDKLLLNCFAGCSYQDIKGALLNGQGSPEIPKKAKVKGQSNGNGYGDPEAIYSYQDENGDLLYQKLRFKTPGGKSFAFRKPDANNGWVWGLDGVRKVLYLLPDVLRALNKGESIYIVEGEKDAQTLINLGLCATTPPEGASGKWLDDYTKSLEGAKAIVVLYDNDAPGKKKAQEIATALRSQVKSLKVIDLPRVEDKEDITDWIEKRGGSRAELLKLVEDTQEWEPKTLETQAPYRATSQGLFLQKPTKDGIIEIPLTNFQARIEQAIELDDGAKKELYFVVLGSVGPHTLPPIRVPASKYNTMQWVTEHWGDYAVINAGHHIKDCTRTAIQYLSLDNDRTRQVIYQHLGWRHLEGQWAYLHTMGAITQAGPLDTVKVEPDAPLSKYSLIYDDTPETLKDAVADSIQCLDIAPDIITIPLLASVYRAPLCELFPAPVTTFLVGQTGVKKSTLLGIAQSHFGKGFDEAHLPASWHSTDNALERLCFCAKDTVLSIDDFAPNGTHQDIQRLHSKAERVIRGQGNLSGRQRMQSNTELRTTYYPRGIILSSGEDTPKGQSLRARMVVVEIGKDSIFLEKLEQAQKWASNGLLSIAMSGYIRWIAKHWETIKGQIEGLFEELRKGFLKTPCTHARIPHTIAHLMLGFHFFLEYAQEAGGLAEVRKEELLDRAREAFTDISNAQAEYQQSEDPADRFLELLYAAVIAGKAHLASVDKDDRPETLDAGDAKNWGWRPLGMQDVPQGDRIGWVKRDLILLQPDIAHKTAQEMARAQGESLGITQRTLWKRLVEKKRIISNKGRFTHQERVNGQSRRVIAIPMPEWERGE